MKALRHKGLATIRPQFTPIVAVQQFPGLPPCRAHPIGTGSREHALTSGGSSRPKISMISSIRRFSSAPALRGAAWSAARLPRPTCG